MAAFLAVSQWGHVLIYALHKEMVRPFSFHSELSRESWYSSTRTACKVLAALPEESAQGRTGCKS